MSEKVLVKRVFGLSSLADSNWLKKCKQFGLDPAGVFTATLSRNEYIVHTPNDAYFWRSEKVFNTFVLVNPTHKTLKDYF